MSPSRALGLGLKNLHIHSALRRKKLGSGQRVSSPFGGFSTAHGTWGGSQIFASGDRLRLWGRGNGLDAAGLGWLLGLVILAGQGADAHGDLALQAYVLGIGRTSCWVLIDGLEPKPFLMLKGSLVGHKSARLGFADPIPVYFREHIVNGCLFLALLSKRFGGDHPLEPDIPSHRAPHPKTHEQAQYGMHVTQAPANLLPQVATQ